jgi:hypothetical protein
VEIVSDTALWQTAGQSPLPIRWVLLRDPEGKFDPQALLCTDPAADPVQSISWFVRRWQLVLRSVAATLLRRVAMETTFQAVRTHLGVETQRQWNDQAILRTTPALMALFPLVTLMAHPHFLAQQHPIRQASWYPKATPTFADAIACLRRHLWRAQGLIMSPPRSDQTKLIPPLHERLIDALCYAA